MAASFGLSYTVRNMSYNYRRVANLKLSLLHQLMNHRNELVMGFQDRILFTILSSRKAPDSVREDVKGMLNVWRLRFPSNMVFAAVHLPQALA